MYRYNNQQVAKKLLYCSTNTKHAVYSINRPISTLHKLNHSHQHVTYNYSAKTNYTYKINNAISYTSKEQFSTYQPSLQASITQPKQQSSTQQTVIQIVDDSLKQLKYTLKQINNNSSYNNQYKNKLKHSLLLCTAVLLACAIHYIRYNTTVHAQSTYATHNPVELTSQIESIAQTNTTPKFPLLTRLWLYIKLLCRLPLLGVMWLPIFTFIWFLGSNRYFLKYIVFVLERSGPGFVKLGQWAATRPDLFHETATDILSTLQTKARPHSLSYSLKTIKNMFPWLIIDVEKHGKLYNYNTPKSTQLQSINNSAGNIRLVVDGNAILGSGSMAQTHKGIVYNNNDQTQTEVAIKILHPKIRQRVESDLILMRSVCYIVDRLPGGFKWLGAGDAIQQFSGFLHSHLDLKGEGNNLTRFAYNFRDNKHIVFPTPVNSLSSNDVLMESLQHGIGLDELMSYTSPALRAHSREIAKLGLRMFLTMMIDHNFIHSDLHPGNILVDIDCDACKREHELKQLQKKQKQRITSDADNTHTNITDKRDLQSHTVNGLVHNTRADVKLLVIDPGLVTELDKRNRANFLSLFGALVEGDGLLAGDLILKYARKQSCTDPEGFKREMNNIVSQIPALDIGAADIGVLLQKVLSIVRNYKVGLETDFASLVVGLVVVEGVGRKLDPKLSLVKEAAPVLIKNNEARNILIERGGMRLVTALTKTATQYLFGVEQSDEAHHAYYNAQRELIESDWDAA